DLFILADQDCVSRLDEVEILARAIEINRRLNFPPFSNDGQYLRVYTTPQMIKSLGSPQDDHDNLFTSRMLLLLESAWVSNETEYILNIDKVVAHYFRDSRGKSSFRPLFLLNDLLRYWRTLCLNYERIRDQPGRPWRKKNINLKFSRMLTVFGTVLPIVAEPTALQDQVRSLFSRTPLERLAYGLDLLGDYGLQGRFTEFLDTYEQFLKWKESIDAESAEQADFNDLARRAASKFSD